MEGAHTDLHGRSKAAEKAVLAAQHHFQAVTAGLSSNADGQDETLAAQKIGVCSNIFKMTCVFLTPPHPRKGVIVYFYFSACENDISTALSEKKQAEMR